MGPMLKIDKVSSLNSKVQRSYIKSMGGDLVQALTFFRQNQGVRLALSRRPPAAHSPSSPPPSRIRPSEPGRAPVGGGFVLGWGELVACFGTRSFKETLKHSDHRWPKGT